MSDPAGIAGQIYAFREFIHSAARSAYPDKPMLGELCRLVNENHVELQSLIACRVGIVVTVPDLNYAAVCEVKTVVALDISCNGAFRKQFKQR